MAPPPDLRAWIAPLEREGELVRVGAEVDPDLEITEINDRVVKSDGPALLFENGNGSRHPLPSNQLGRIGNIMRVLGHVRSPVTPAERTDGTCRVTAAAVATAPPIICRRLRRFMLESLPR